MPDVLCAQRYMQLHDEVELSALGMGKSLAPRSSRFIGLGIFLVKLIIPTKLYLYVLDDLGETCVVLACDANDLRLHLMLNA